MTRRNGTQKRRCPFCNRLVVTLYPATHQAKYTGHHIRMGYVCDYCASMGLEYGKPVAGMTPEEKHAHYKVIARAFGAKGNRPVQRSLQPCAGIPANLGQPVRESNEDVYLFGVPQTAEGRPRG